MSYLGYCILHPALGVVLVSLGLSTLVVLIYVLCTPGGEVTSQLHGRSPSTVIENS